MALYKYGQYLTKSENAAFDGTYGPGKTVPLSGIYRCMNCGREIASNENDPFPPQNHHQHPSSAAIAWKLVVYADHRAK